MPKVQTITFEHGGKIVKTQYHYWCPGCNFIHALSPDIHKFNGDFDRPTFTPSVLYDYSEEHRCHSYINDGNIQFLNDCSHSLAGQTVELPEYHE